MKVILPQQIGFMKTEIPGLSGTTRLAVTGLLGFSLVNPPGDFASDQDIWAAVTGNLSSDDIFDLWMPKPGAEVLMWGSAESPQPVESMRVSLRCGQIRRELQVHGDRTWQPGLMGWRAGPPKPFSSMPLQWKHTYGGTGHNECPVGAGFNAMRLLDDGKIVNLPNITPVGGPLKHPDDPGQPVCFGAVNPTWPAFAPKGNFDKRWMAERHPQLPEGFDSSFYYLAQPQQRQASYWLGGESIELTGVHPQRPVITGVVPEVRMRCFVQNKASPLPQEWPMQIDTVALFPATLMGIMVFRATVEDVDTDARGVSHLMLGAEWTSIPRPQEHYFEVFKARGDAAESADDLLDDAHLMPQLSEAQVQQIIHARAAQAHDRYKQALKRWTELRRQAAAAVGLPVAQLPLSSSLPQPGLESASPPEGVAAPQPRARLSQLAANDLAARADEALDEWATEVKSGITQDELLSVDNVPGVGVDSANPEEPAAAQKGGSSPAQAQADETAPVPLAQQLQELLQRVQNGKDPLGDVVRDLFFKEAPPAGMFQTEWIDGELARLSEIGNDPAARAHLAEQLQAITSVAKEAQEAQASEGFGANIEALQAQLPAVSQFGQGLQDGAHPQSMSASMGWLAGGTQMAANAAIPPEAVALLTSMQPRLALQIAQAAGQPIPALQDQQQQEAALREALTALSDLNTPALNVVELLQHLSGKPASADSLMARLAQLSGSATAVGPVPSSPLSTESLDTLQEQLKQMGGSSSVAMDKIRDVFAQLARADANGDMQGLLALLDEQPTVDDIESPIGPFDTESAMPLQETAGLFDHDLLTAPLPEMPDAHTARLRHDAHAALVAPGAVDASRDATLALLAQGGSLRGRDLSGIDLSGANLSGVDFTNTLLEHADLSGANLTGATLVGATLLNANLTGATLNGATLRDVNAGNIRATGSSWNGANLQGARLADACLNGARLVGARLDHCHAQRAQFRDADLAHSTCTGGDFSSAIFDAASMNNVQWEDADLRDATLHSCRAGGARIVNCYLADCKGQQLVLDGAVLDRSVLLDAQLPGLSARGLQAIDSSWFGSQLAGADFTGAVLRDAYFSQTLLNGASLARTDLADAVLSEACARGANFQKAQMFGASLRCSDLTAADMREAVLVQVDVTGATLDLCDLTAANLTFGQLATPTHG